MYTTHGLPRLRKHVPDAWDDDEDDEGEEEEKEVAANNAAVWNDAYVFPLIISVRAR